MNVLTQQATTEGQFEQTTRFAVVRSEAISESYGEALEKLLGLIGERRRFTNYREGELSDQHIRVSDRTKGMLETLAQGQVSDIIVIAAQLGLRHRGKSVRRAIETFTGNEFGLTSSAVGCIALTHPERFQKFDQLHIDCSGDEYSSPGAVGQFVYAPIFYWNDGGLRFNDRWTDDADRRCGSASGFLPQE